MKKRIISLLLVLLWMLFIYFMSSRNAIDSIKNSNFIIELISKVWNIDNINNISFIVRKLAHFSEYLILSLLMINLLSNYNISFYWGIVFGLLYAITDEIHQLFVPGRSYELRDILIDLSGILIGFLFYFIINKIRHKSS